MQTLPHSLHIGVIRGGPSSEYDISLKTGDSILRALSETHRPFDILISRDGTWHINGIERTPERILKNIDVVYNALHGTFGEDGGIQDILDQYAIPYTGSDKLSSAMAINKSMTKERLKDLGIKSPLYFTLSNEDNIGKKVREVHTSIPYPVIIKPTSSGSSLGITIARSPDEMIAGIEKAFSFGEKVIIEEYISGREATCGVINNFRNQKTYTLPPIEIHKSNPSSFHDYDSKYTGQSSHVSPGAFSLDEKKEIERVTALVHDTLGLRHYSRSDFIVSPRRGVYFLEVNTLPGMTSTCPFPKSLESVGVSTKDFIDHILLQALQK